MRTFPHFPVREHQRLVLFMLRCANQPLTPSEIAQKLNSCRHRTGLPESSEIDVEASLATLMLRPELAGLVTCTTRRATPVERRERLQTRLGALGAVVILSACTALPRPAPEHASRAPSYFGNALPIAKPPASLSRPLFPGTVFAIAEHGIATLPDTEPIEFASKTPAAEATAGLAYFSNEAIREYPVRADADLAPANLLADSAVTASPTHKPTASATSFMSATRAPSVRTLPGSTVEPAWTLAPSLPTLTLALDVPPSAPSIANLPPPGVLKAAPGAMRYTIATPEATPARKPGALHAPLDFGDSAKQDVYDDLVTFANGSRILSPQAKERAMGLLQAAKNAASIQLRGRVGYRTLNAETAKQAVGRAVAVREFLIANGISKEKVRIHMPRNNDLVNASAPADESNRSVSVFMQIEPPVAASIGLKHGHPITQATKLASTG
jgi:hypothetical protein